MRQEVLDDDRNVVSALRQGLATRIGSERFNLWFGSHVQLELAGEAVVISAPDEFTLERVRRQFGREIQTTLASIAVAKYHTEFRVRARGIQSTAPDALSSPRTAETSVGSTETSIVQIQSSSALPGTLEVEGPKPNVPEKVRFLKNGPTQCGPLKIAPGAIGGGTTTASGDFPTRRRYARFDTFVVGQSNRVALTAAQSVAQRLGVISPLFIYGPTGSGKSHLLESVWMVSRTEHKTSRCLLLSAEQFTTHFLEALQGTGLPSFRRKVRDIDLLLIDDIHFLAGKRATLVEFQHTLDALARQSRQLVIASDRAPAELTGLGPELLARLTGGLVCGLDLADYETRLGITQQWVTRDNLKLPAAVTEMIALETNGDARQIRGALNRLQATSMAFQQPVTVEMARTALSDIFASGKRVVRLPDIERVVCDTFGLEPKALRESGKSRATSQPRMLAMWLARKYTRMAFSEISEFFGRRSHTTVILAEQKVNRWVADGVQLQLGRTSWSAEDAIRRLETKLRTG